MNDIFLREWRLYRRSAFRAPFAGEPPAGEAEFDSPVKPGDIRVFADSNRPFVALVVEDRGLSGRRIVPVSPFTAPASSREMLLGERVLQLWNATVASRRFTDRSWLVDQVAGDEVAKVLAALPAAHPGRVAAGDDVLARYEREFLVTGGGFVPFVSRRREAARPFWQHGGWKIAASLLVCIGAFYFIIGGGQDGLRRWSEGHVRAMCFSAEDSVELLDAPEDAPAEPAMSAPEVDVAKDIALASAAPAMPSPRRPEASSGVSAASRPLVPAETVRRLEDRFAATRQAAFLRPARARTARIELSPAERRVASAAPPATRVGAYAARGVSAAEPRPLVECRIASCPWDSSRRLLEVRVVRAPSRDGAAVELEFLPETVVAYRRLAGAIETNGAFYEIVPAPAAGADAVFCRAHAVWSVEYGLKTEPVEVRATTPAELGRVAAPADDAVPSAPSATSPDDVPVDVRFR